MADTALSRTQQKKADQALRKLGDALVALSPENLDRMDLSETLRSAILMYGQIGSHTARRRQWKTIAALLRDVDRAPIRAALENIRRGDRAQARRHRRLEQWRDGLKAGDFSLMAEIIDACPGVERQRLGQLARSAAKEAARGTGVKSARALFRYLADCLPEGGGGQDAPQPPHTASTP